MPLDDALVGASFPPTPAREATEEGIAAFAAATHTPRRAGGPAPATYPIVVAFEAMRALMADPEVGIELRHVVHGEQRFAHQRPVMPGDRLSAVLTVESLRRIAGAEVIGTSSAIRDDRGELVCTAWATLVHRAEA